MERREFLTAMGGATTAVLAGCGGDGGPTATATNQGEVVVTVEMSTRSFDPAIAEINVGEAVEWVNQTNEVRRINPIDAIDDPNVDVEDWDWGEPGPAGTAARSVMQPEGGRVTRTFNREGVFAYEDSLLTQFQACGVVRVGDADPVEESSLPCAAFM